MGDAFPAAIVQARLQALRQAMRSQGLQAAVFLTSDPHLSEYLPAHWQSRRWFSGFSGSAGTLVVTADFAGLWTDSRYWEQAQADLAGTALLLMRAGHADVLPPHEWLAQHGQAGDRIWTDFSCLPVQLHAQWQARLEPAGLSLVDAPALLDALWPQRPALPCAAVFEHLPPQACRTRAENLAALRCAMAQAQADWHLLSSLDDIAWLFNLRGADIPYNPVFLAFLLLGTETAILFVDDRRIAPDLQARLRADGIDLRAYEDVGAVLATLAPGQSLLFDPARTTLATQAHFSHLVLHAAPNPSQRLKACKLPAEAAQIRATMEADGAALCGFFAWLEAALAQGEPITELTVDERITQARAAQPGFVSPSFATIAGFNANGAMPHYQATPQRHAAIAGNGLLLIDSGGQYLGGTTDITRVVPVGQPSAAQRCDYTRVLRGMIALSQLHFPEGTPGPMLDAVARAPLWQAGLDYGHGTGHGVGYFLNVHEGPQSISSRRQVDEGTALLEGMVTSNEPGLYRPGQWGIRIENLVLAVAAEASEFGRFLRFETLTLCPIDTRCIDASLLQASDIAWLDAYHAEVRARLLPHVDGAARDWLLQRTEPLETAG